MRSLEFLEFTSQPLAPPPPSSSSASPLPHSSTAAGRLAAPPEATSCSSAAPRVAPELAHRLSPSLLALPEHAAAAHRRCSTASATSCSGSSHASPSGRPPPSSLPLAFSQARHATPPLPELRPAATTRRRSTAAPSAYRASS
jgi:hypothetical protein